MEGVDPLEGLDPAESRHHQVEHDGVGTVPLDAEQGLEPVRRLQDLEAGVSKGLDEHLPDIRVVVRNQHPHESSLHVYWRASAGAAPAPRPPAAGTGTNRRSRSAPMLTSRTRRGPRWPGR